MSNDLKKIYQNMKVVFIRNRSAYLKANELECELGNAVWNDDSDAEYDILEERGEAWTKLDQALEPALKAMKKLTKDELAELRKMSHADCNSCNNRETLWLLEYMDNKLLEAFWNAPEEAPKRNVESGLTP